MPSSPSTVPFSQILICTHNAHKLQELQEMLCDLPIRILSFRDIPNLPEPEETGDSFVQNALIKADAAFAHTGIPSLADDSGLVVPALENQPGVHSARYAGVDGPQRDQANRQKLIQAISAVPPEKRQAYFHCSLILRWQPDKYAHFPGQCHGIMVTQESGQNGFGYDPIFFLPSHQRTLAELSPTEKNNISHRAQSILALRSWLSRF